MKHAFDRFVQYLQKNYFSYWIVLGIDTFIALVCTWVSFIGIHYITETPKGNYRVILYSGNFSCIQYFRFRFISYLSQYDPFFPVEGIVATGGECTDKGRLLSNCHLVPSVSNGLAQQSENSLCTVRWHAYFYCYGRVPYPVDSGL